MIKSSDSFNDRVGNIICFTLNKSANRVITVSDRTVFKLYNIDNGENGFIEKAINQLGNAVNLCIMDIGWSHLDESMVISCGSNAELYKLRVTESELRLDTSYFNKKFHHRTINKIHIHPNDPNLVISGDSDGVICLFDLRTRDVASRFRHDANHEDRVTDIQFNPSPSSTHYFASGSDNGYVFVWDYREPSRCERRNKPHLSGVRLDWHPKERNLLATGSKDKYIYVWDVNSQNNAPLHTVMHCDPIANIKWRPDYNTQIAACSSSPMDPRLYVWDFHRPYVPYASFDSVLNFAWRNSTNVLITGNRCLSKKNISDAVKPADRSSLVATDINRYGSIAFAFSETSHTNNQIDETFGQTDHDQANTVALNFRITKSKMLFDDQIKDLRSDWFLYASKNYKFKNDTFENLCDHNADIAVKYNKYSIFKDWKILKTMYKDRDESESHLKFNCNKNSISAPVMPNNENTFISSTTVPTRRFSDTSAVDNNMAVQYYQDNSSPEGEQLNEDAFNLKIDDLLNDDAITNNIIEFNDINELFDDSNHMDNQIELVEFIMPQIDNQQQQQQQQQEQQQQQQKNKDTNETNNNVDLVDSNMNALNKEFKFSILPKHQQQEVTKLCFDEHFKSILFAYIEDNDLPTTITMLLVLANSSKFEKNQIDEFCLNEWFAQYIELLSKFELWNIRVAIIKSHQSDFIQKLTQNSITYPTMCSACKKQIPAGQFKCSNCNKNPFLCSYCHLPVRKELYTWCHVCCHGGHYSHLQEWFKKHNKCPSCGCNCWSDS